MKDGISRSVTSFRSKTGCDLLLEPRPDIKIGDLYVMKAGETDLVNVYTNLKNVIKPRGSTGTPLVIDTIKYDDMENNSDFSNFTENKLKIKFLINWAKALKAKVTGNFENVDFNRLKFYFKGNTRERIISSGDINKSLMNYSIDYNAYKFDFKNSYWVVIDRMMSKNCAICSVASKKQDAGVMLEFSKQFEASAGRKVNIEGKECFVTAKENKTEFVYAIRLAHLNNQLARIETDLFLDPAVERPTTSHLRGITGFTKSSGGISSPYLITSKDSSKTMPTFYNVFEINETMEPKYPDSILDLKRATI